MREFTIKRKKYKKGQKEKYEFFDSEENLHFWYKIEKGNVYLTQPYENDFSFEKEVNRRKVLLLTETIQIKLNDFRKLADLIERKMVVDKI